MAIKIEKNIPMPVRRNYSEERGALKELRVGESFLFKQEKSASVVHNALALVRFRPKRFALRTMRDGSGVRIWRIE